MATQCPGTTYKTEDDAFVSIIDGIRKKALSHPDSPALSFLPDGKAENAELCSYSRLDMRARAIAAAIQATGQGDGRPVLLMLPPGLEFIAAFFGCLYARAIAVPMTPPGLARMARTFNRLARIVEDSGSRVFITSARLRKAVEELAERVHFADSIRIICLDETDDALSRSWQELPLTAHTPGWLQYTSGSTSSPKGVIITHGNIMANLDSIAGHMRLRENIPIVSWLPPFHDMGLVGGILTPLHLGCLCVTMPPMAFLRQPLCWLRAVTHYRAQLTGGPNFAYDLCCDRIPEDRLRELDLSSLSVCYCGSEPIRLKTIRRFLERFSSAGLDPASFYPCYGLAENTLFTTGCWKNDGDFAVFLDKQEYAAGRIRFLQEQHADAMPLLSCGTAGRNNDVRIVDPQTCREVEEKDLGEIWIRGTCVSPGYWEQPEATKTVLHAVLAGSGEGPFLRTGDMGFMSGGHLFVSGRCKEMIILNGRNFSRRTLRNASCRTCRAWSRMALPPSASTAMPANGWSWSSRPACPRQPTRRRWRPSGAAFPKNSTSPPAPSSSASGMACPRPPAARSSSPCAAIFTFTANCPYWRNGGKSPAPGPPPGLVPRRSRMPPPPARPGKTGCVTAFPRAWGFPRTAWACTRRSAPWAWDRPRPWP